MLVELATAVLLLKFQPVGSAWLMWPSLGLLVVIWLATALLSMPAHNSLTAEYTTTAYRTLVSTNWIRTLAWTARAILVLVIADRNMK